MKRKKQHGEVIIVFLIVYGLVILPNFQLLKAEPSASLLMNEVMYHPTENENTNEWIELYNPTSNPIDVADWMIADEKETDTLRGDIDHGDGTTIIPPNSYAIITDKGTTIYETFTTADNAVRLYVDDSTLCGYGLNNQKEKLLLMDTAGTLIDAIEWGTDYDDVAGSPAASVIKGSSLGRSQQADTDDSSLDFIEYSTPTPGSQNIQEEQPANNPTQEDSGCRSPSLLITELYYYTHSNINNEFVRLTNPTTHPVDVSGWYLTDEPWKEPDDQPKILFPEHTKIPANTSWYVTKNASDFIRETVTTPTFEYAVDSMPTIPQLLTYRTVTFSNTGGLVAVYTAASTLIDLVIFGDTNQYISCWEGPSIPSSGQGVILKRNSINGTYIDTNTASDWDHRRIYHIGQSDFPLQTFITSAEITAFVSPDNSYDAITNELRAAQHTIDMNMYEFTNPFLYDELINALKRNVIVRLFMEGSPIGGIDDREKYILQKLAENGGSVRFIVSDADNDINARYQFDHAKYLIIDNQTVIVESCNWAKTGIPKNPTFGNREWGIIIRNQDIATYFAQVFQDDYSPSHADSYPIDAMNFSIPEGFSLNYDIPTGSYTPQFSPHTITGPSIITPVFSPDTSEQAILEAIQSATTSIYIQQLYIYKDWEDILSPFIQHLINKSQEGIRVQVILDYNPAFVGTIDKLNETKQILEEYGMSVKFLSTEWSPFATVHNKGMIIDNKTVLISSINWNEQSVRKNREAGILLENQDAATYYASVFFYDWSLDSSLSSNPGFSWAEYKYLVLIAVVFSITLFLIIRDWRKRKWR